MANTHLYLASTLPQWEIFLGIALITMGYIEKKGILTRIGWIVLMITGLTALYFNLFGELTSLADSQQNNINSLLKSTSWEAVAGGVLAVFSLLLFHYQKKRYPVLAVLTIIYFVLIFFLYYQVSQGPAKLDQSKLKTEQEK